MYSTITMTMMGSVERVAILVIIGAEQGMTRSGRGASVEQIRSLAANPLCSYNLCRAVRREIRRRLFGRCCPQVGVRGQRGRSLG